MATNYTFKQNNGIYFPLFNTKGLRASITPFFGGDLKTDHHHYALEPVTEVDLYHPHFSRNVIFSVDGNHYFLNGQTEKQQNDVVEASYDPFIQKVIRKNELFQITTSSFIPTDGMVEVHQISYKNITKKVQALNITTAIPMYGRSADNLRDHRHVTSLLNRISVEKEGIILKPTLSFDERGHQKNHTIYSVFASSNDLHIKGYLPVLADFMGGGSLMFPRGLDKVSPVGTEVHGYEAMGGIQFDEIEVEAGAKVKLIITLGIHESMEELESDKRFLNHEVVQESLNQTKAFFENYQQGLSFKIADEKITNQLSWVVLQPMLRRYFGNSYLPHHDYGRGGRGWRDLWQDLLALIMMNDSSVIDLLYNNFAGIRIDGSNATIIGDKAGEFKADRNMITRVWSDHGAWPLITTKLYIDETGDLDFLLKEQTYFMDQFTHLTRKTRSYSSPKQIDETKNIYQGTILEHLLLQNLVGFHNIGDHGFVRLEDADWNDGLDMAHQKGETISFTHMYAANIKLLAELIEKLPFEHVTLFHDLEKLFEDKANLKEFFDHVADFKGIKQKFSKNELVSKLNQLYKIRVEHLSNHAFKKDRYQSYFNNDGVDIDSENTLNLTGQTMALMNLTANPDQARKVAQTTKEMLYVKDQGGYRLNSNYHQVLTNMGRAYGFAYGHKENGAVFSHMAVMYAYGLYRYNLVDYGREAIFTLLYKALDPKASVLLGIPEYFNDRGIGMYPYLTGSASWMILVLRQEVFGIKFDQGIMRLEPKLMKADFISGKASITTFVKGVIKTITYHNDKNLEYGDYRIKNVIENEAAIEVYLDEIC